MSTKGDKLAIAPVTKTNILRKVNRKKNPVQSIAQLAREFGFNTTYYRWEGGVGQAAPVAFRKQVKDLVGVKTYNKIRDSKSINTLYR